MSFDAIVTFLLAQMQRRTKGIDAPGSLAVVDFLNTFTLPPAFYGIQEAK